jgi:nucleotide-binding universal stress UspA family protein
VTERVVRRAGAPVLTVRATEGTRPAGDYTDVLVPTDGSDPAAAGVEHGLAVAERVGARVHAVSVVDASRFGGSPDLAPAGEFRERLAGEAERATEAVAERATAVGLDAVTHVRRGSPARALLEYAEGHGVDLIAMGTRGRSGPGRYVLGSTTERTIRRSEVPVLAVNARDA